MNNVDVPSGDTSRQRGTVISGDLDATDADGLTTPPTSRSDAGGNSSAAIDADFPAPGRSADRSGLVRPDQFTVTVINDEGGRPIRSSALR